MRLLKHQQKRLHHNNYNECHPRRKRQNRRNRLFESRHHEAKKHDATLLLPGFRVQTQCPTKLQNLLDRAKESLASSRTVLHAVHTNLTGKLMQSLPNTGYRFGYRLHLLAEDNNTPSNEVAMLAYTIQRNWRLYLHRRHQTTIEELAWSGVPYDVIDVITSYLGRSFCEYPNLAISPTTIEWEQVCWLVQWAPLEHGMVASGGSQFHRIGVLATVASHVQLWVLHCSQLNLHHQPHNPHHHHHPQHSLPPHHSLPPCP
eukprot:TRINITY_DN66651_c5_g1_i2.p1 TRINITY_DN66651_c5_g1~~TRINITY_DN66651_c5_g1_i2.p1  ORF type:complete len:259 (+),score=8.16 TRINITY_DN66651_c5_g1_i2:85-861(+)